MDDDNPALLAALAARGIGNAEVVPTGGNCWAISWPVGQGLLLLATSDCDVATEPADMPYWSFTIGDAQGGGVVVGLGLAEGTTVDQLADALVRYVPAAVGRARSVAARAELRYLTLAELTTDLDGEQDQLPACPSCQQRRWKVDEEVTVRAAIVLGDDDETVVFVDRAGGDPARLPERLQGNIVCHACAFELPLDDVAAGAVAAIYHAAMQLAGSGEARWEILNDYREF
jgi:hypothetical protein